MTAQELKETGQKLFKSGQFAEAIPLLKSAAETLPKDEPLWQELVMVARDSGQHGQAAEFAKLGIRHHPRSDWLWRTLGSELVEVDKLDEAEKAFDNARSLLGHTTGEAQEGPPWLAAKVKDRVGVLKSRFQQAEKLFKEADPAIYESFACDIYGRLRETWERAVEELLLNDSVRRFRRSIETNRLAKLSDIKSEDIEFIEAAMTKCSKYLRGHDKAVAINEPVPALAGLKADIESLEKWVLEMRKRR